MEQTEPRRIPLAEQALVVALLAAFYGYTCSHVIGSGDTALLADGIFDRTISTHSNNHNITVLTGWALFKLLPSSVSLARIVNLTSTALGVLAMSVFWRALREAFASRWTAWATMTAMAVSHSMWWHSTTGEVYAANALLVSAAFLFLQRYQRSGAAKDVLGLFFVSGLAFFNHIQLGIIGVAATWLMIVRFFVETERSKRSVRAGVKWFLTCSAVFFVGFLPYLLTFIKDARMFHSAKIALKGATGGDFQSLMFQGTFAYGLRETGVLVFMQFPTPFLLAIAAGVWFAWRRWGWKRSLPGLAGMFAVNTYFFMHFDTWDRFAFLLPSFLCLAWIGAFGVDELVRRATEKRAWRAPAIVAWGLVVATPPWFYAHLAGWARDPRSFWANRYGNGSAEHLFDQASYVTNPDKHAYREFDRFGRELLAKLPPRAVYFDDDGHSYYQLKYLQRFEKLRPDVDVRMVNSWGFSNWGDTAGAFTGKLERAYRANLPFFLIGDDDPYDKFIENARKRRDFQFEPFVLHEGSWVLRLKTAKDVGDVAASGTAVPPVLLGLDVGTGFDTPDAKVRDRFAVGERIMVRLRTERNLGVYDLVYEWKDAAGRVAYTAPPFEVPLWNTSIWGHLAPPEPTTAGVWTVTAIATGAPPLSTTFTVGD